MGGGLRMRGTRVCLWPIDTDVWQKPSQCGKAIILQLNNFFKKALNICTCNAVPLSTKNKT